MRRLARADESRSGWYFMASARKAACRPPCPAEGRPCRTWYGSTDGVGWPGSLIEEPFLDELLGGHATVRIEAAVLEQLLVFQVDVVLAAADLLERGHHPVAIALGLVRVELDVDLGDDVVLVVQDQDDIALVVDGAAAAQVVVAQALRLQPLAIGRDDGDDGDLQGE